MGLRQKLASWTWRITRKSAMFALMMRHMNVSFSLTGADYAQMAEEAYEQNPYVYSAVSQIANSCAGIPPVLYRIRSGTQLQAALDGYQRKAHSGERQRQKKRRTLARITRRHAMLVKEQTGLPYALARHRVLKALVQTGELERIDGHEVLDLLERPNPWTQRSYQQYIQAFVTYLELGGMAFQEPNGPDSGPPRELYAHAPQEVEFKKGDNQAPIKSFKFGRGADAKEYQYSPDPKETQIFYSKYFHPRQPLKGLSPVEAAAKSIDINNQGRLWNFSLLKNGGEYSGVLTAEGKFTAEQLASLKEQHEQMYQGAQNAGKVLHASGTKGIDFKPISMTPKDMQWGALNTASAREVSLVWNFPVVLLGDMDNATYSNYQEARKALYLDKVVPLMDFVFGEFNSSWMPLFGDDLFLDYDLDRVDALQEDVNEMHERVRKDVEGSLLTINEGREALGRDPVDGGNVILVPAAKLPLEAAAQETEEEGEERARQLLSVDGATKLFDLHVNGDA